MTDYGQFVDEEIQKHARLQEQADALRRQKTEDEAAALKAVSDPLDRVLLPALNDATNQLREKGIDVDTSSMITHGDVGNFKVFRHFRLKKSRKGGGYTTTELYFFRVYPSGDIEGGFFDINAGGRQEARRILAKPSADFQRQDVEEVIKEAIGALISRLT